MNIKKLSRYGMIKEQIEAIRERLAELDGNYINASNLTGMPKQNRTSNPVELKANKIIALKEKLKIQIDKLLDEEIMIQNFINSIDDIKIQTIVRLKFIELKTWNEIADILHYSRVAPYLQLKEYLKKYNNV